MSALIEANPRLAMGDNNPPGPIDFARDTFRAVSQFLAAMPVIASEEDAREAKWHLDRAKNSLKDLEATQKKETAPLYNTWKEAVAKYKTPIDQLEKIMDELSSRLSAFMRAEENRRRAEAELIRAAAEAADRQAREAIQREQEARENASVGELGVDLATAIEATDEAVSDAKTLSRRADIAERDTHVRIGGGYGRVTTLREKKTLVLDDAVKALLSIGVTDKIKDAILSSARDYRKLKGEIPAGVSETSERGI
jgi:hypothetical protein